VQLSLNRLGLTIAWFNLPPFNGLNHPFCDKGPGAEVGVGGAKDFEEFPAVGDQLVRVTPIAPARASGAKNMTNTRRTKKLPHA
jgi:hypothetical protein